MWIHVLKESSMSLQQLPDFIVSLLYLQQKLFRVYHNYVVSLLQEYKKPTF